MNTKHIITVNGKEYDMYSDNVGSDLLYDKQKKYFEIINEQRKNIIRL